MVLYISTIISTYKKMFSYKNKKENIFILGNTHIHTSNSNIRYIYTYAL